MSKKTDNPTRLSDIEKLLEQLLKVQKATLDTQQDIRALLLAARNSNHTEEPNCEDWLTDAGNHLYQARRTYETSHLLAKIKESEDTRNKLESDHSLKRNERRHERFWSKYLASKDMKFDMLSLIMLGRLSYRDLLLAQRENKKSPTNITRSASELETKIRKFLRTAPESKEHFQNFLDETNKPRSNYAKVPLNYFAMDVILDLVS